MLPIMLTQRDFSHLVRFILFEEFLFLPQILGRGQSIDIEYAIQMVYFMLENPGGPTIQTQPDVFAMPVQSADTNRFMTRYFSDPARIV